MLVGPFLALEDPANVDHIGALGTAAGSYSALAVAFKPSAFPNTFPIASSMADQASVLVAAAKRQHLDSVALVRSTSEVAAEGATAFRSDARPRPVSPSPQPPSSSIPGKLRPRR